MKQANFYHTQESITAKTFCALAEKLYMSNHRAFVLTPDYETQEELNKYLWTYSKSKFIPHGSSEDLMAERQPIYITNSKHNNINLNINKANTIVLVNTVENFIEKPAQFTIFNKLINIYNKENIHYNNNSTMKAVKTLQQMQVEIIFYNQTLEGKWTLEEMI